MSLRKSIWYVLALATGLLLASCDQRSPQFEPKRAFVVLASVQGKSMLPYVKEERHPVLLDVAFSYDNLKVGDVVIYWNYKWEQFVMHRIEAKQGSAFIVRGDNPETNPVSDPGFLTREGFVGKVVADFSGAPNSLQQGAPINKL